MSETVNPPEYFFTNIDFNPAFYANNLPPEDQALLDARYVKFPVAQNVPITFTATVRGLTAFLTENSTIIATTQWVQNFFNYIKTIANTWTGLQTFTLGMLSNTVNPTTPSGTLIIGNTAVNTNVEIATQTGRTSILHLGDGTGATTTGGIHIGNGLASTNAVNILYSSTDAGSSGIINLGAVNGTVNLRCPLTPNYATLYPIGTGKIGQIISSQLATFTVTTAGTIYDLTTISLTQGVWVITGDTGGPALSTYVRIGFGTAPVTISRGGVNMIQNASNSSLCNTSATISLTSTTTIYFIGTFGTAQTLTNVLLQACRIA